MKRSKLRLRLHDKVFDFGIPKYLLPLTLCDEQGKKTKNPGNI